MTVVSVRSLPLSGQVAPVLAGIGIALPTAPAAGGLTEFILRDEAGRAVSVVQPNALDLRPGDRVILQTGPATRLARGTD